jgi:stress response protein YsnF
LLGNGHAGAHQVTQRFDDRETLPVVEERAIITKHKKLTGGVRVRTVVHEDEEIVDAPFSTERVEVARVRLDRWVEAPIPVRREGGTTIITLHEEVVVVEKRLRATEEIHLTRARSTRSAPQRVTLRREEAVVEQLDVATGEDAPA